MLSTIVPVLGGALWIAAILLVTTASTAAMHKGQWKSHRSSTGLVWFESDLGRFAFLPSGMLNVQDGRGPERHVALGDVLSLRFSYQRLESREAQEAVGFHMWSRRGWPYQLDRYDVALVTLTGDIDVFVAAQAFRPLPFAGRPLNLAVALLDRWGFIPNVDAHARAVVDELRHEFARRGRPVSLA